ADEQKVNPRRRVLGYNAKARGTNPAGFRVVTQHPGLMSAIVGIDLGTTYSAIAALDERGRPFTVPNRDGDMLTPSAVLFAGPDAVVGQPALDVALEEPDRVATLVKRRMGYDDF